MLSAHRFASITNPGYVHFDVTRDASIPRATGLDVFKYNYGFDAGDGSAETFSTTSRTSNTGTGPVFGHVYRDAGSYTCTLTTTLCDTAGVTPSVWKFTQAITVSAFAGTDIHIATAGDDTTGNGSSGSPYQTLTKGLNELFSANGPRRLRLNKGDTFAFTTVRSTPETRTGFFMIDAYGTGAAPIITNSSGNTVIRPTSSSNWEYIQMGIQMDCSGTNTHAFRPAQNCLMIDCTINNPHWGVYADENASHQSYDTATNGVSYFHTAYNCVWNCAINSSAQYGMYWDHGTSNTVAGTTMNGATAEHLIRCYQTHACFRHNLFTGTLPQGKHALKFVGYFATGHADRHGTESTETVEWCSITDNICNALASNWNMVFGPVDDTKPQIDEYLWIERNLIRATATTSQVGIYINCRNKIARNNIIIGTGASGTVTGVRVTRRNTAGSNGEIVCSNIIVAHNTAYRSGGGTAMRCGQASEAASGDVDVVQFYGNIAQSPSSADAVSNTTASSNIIESPAASSAVQGTNLSMTDPANEDFTLQSGSVCRAAAIVTPYAMIDFRIGTFRARATTLDAGAYTFSTQAETPENSFISSGGAFGGMSQYGTPGLKTSYKRKRKH